MIGPNTVTPNTVVSTLAIIGTSTAVWADTPKDIATAEMEALFVTFDAEATEKLLAEDLIQHTPEVPTGRDVLVGLIPTLKESGIKVTTHRLIAEGELVVAHNTYYNGKF